MWVQKSLINFGDRKPYYSETWFFFKEIVIQLLSILYELYLMYANNGRGNLC